MMKTHTDGGPTPYLRASIAALLLIGTCHAVDATEAALAPLSHDQKDAVTLVGTCPSGESYRLHAYRKGSGENALPFYDYEGPVGQGTVQVDTLPKVMAARVCIKTAEIINRDYLSR